MTFTDDLFTVKRLRHKIVIYCEKFPKKILQNYKSCHNSSYTSESYILIESLAVLL